MRGKLSIYDVIETINRDHPRGCGENDSLNVIGNMNTGSPPRMRGKQERAVGIVQQSRITPADAGKTSCRSKELSGNRDHPRGCGENGTLWSDAQRETGSPPRMRGKPI